MREKASAVNLILLLSLVCVTYPGASKPELEAYGGFAGVTVKEKLNPLYICISEMDEPLKASLKLTQKLGSPWRGRAKMKLVTPSRIWKNGCYQTVLPVYDVTEPLKISLIGPEGAKDSSQIDLKERWRKESFPLGVGSISSDFSSLARKISPTELPERWMAYKDLSSLWIGKTGAGISAPKWSAIAKWVYMGGRLVIFGGSNFPVLDSRKLRKLLPIGSPRLIKGNENHRLTGEAKPGTRVLLEDGEGPLMRGLKFGAGKVFLVAEDSSGPKPDEIKAIESQVTSANIFSMKSLVENLLSKEKINSPGRLLALLTASPLLVALLVFSKWPRDDRKKALSLAMAAISLSVIPIMTIEQEQVTRDIYSVSANLHLDVEGGLNTSWQKLYSKSQARIHLLPGAEPYPMVDMPRKLKSGNFDTTWIGGRGLELTVEEGSERKIVYSTRKEGTNLNVRRTDEEKVEIESRLNYDLGKAFIIDRNKIFRVRGPGKGGDEYELDRKKIGKVPTPYRAVLKKVTEGFHLSKGSWFVGISDKADHPEWNGLSTSSRKIDIHLVKIRERGAKEDGE